LNTIIDNTSIQEGMMSHPGCGCGLPVFVMVRRRLIGHPAAQASGMLPFRAT
jgi:hypothetical protein